MILPGASEWKVRCKAKKKQRNFQNRKWKLLWFKILFPLGINNTCASAGSQKNKHGWPSPGRSETLVGSSKPHVLVFPTIFNQCKKENNSSKDQIPCRLVNKLLIPSNTPCFLKVHLFDVLVYNFEMLPTVSKCGPRAWCGKDGNCRPMEFGDVSGSFSSSTFITEFTRAT